MFKLSQDVILKTSDLFTSMVTGRDVVVEQLHFEKKIGKKKQDRNTHNGI